MNKPNHQHSVSLKVKDYMKKQRVFVEPETPIIEAIYLLLKHKIPGIPVIDKKGILVGMLSEQDCLKNLVSGSYHEEEVGGLVSSYMSKDVDSIEPEADIIAATRLFVEKKRRRLPVVKNGVLLGHLSRHHVLRALTDIATHQQHPTLYLIGE